ncbi:hypothetical protein ABS71_18455 [bacterium SCN 62-11]|nr:hypothetical protein [Candidatus Eremiobacteraeota bacterium]ODT58806.1 MAG: hypothetical protein ABS71_18455 [bacterium SCN 62-11]
MPIFNEIYEKAGVCSFSQSWSPIWYPGTEECTRGCLVILASETHQQPLFTEVVPVPLDLDGQLAWLDKSFKQHGAPAELLVNSEELALALRLRCPHSTIAVDPSPRHHARIRESMWPPASEMVPFSVVGLLGERKAREFYADCERFLRLELWRQIQDDEILRFSRGSKEFGVVVGGSTRFQDSGISLFASLKDAAKQNQPVTCFGPGNALLVHYHDLNFLEACQIRIPQLLPRLKFPMVCLDKKDRLSALKDLIFLVRELPALVGTGKKSAEQGKRRLERTETRVKSGRAGLFPAYWDRMAS